MHVNSLQKGWCIYHPGSQLFCSIIFASVEVTTNDSTTFIIGKNNLTNSTPFFSQFSYSDYQDRFSSTIPNNKPFPFDYSKVYFMSSQTIIQMGVIHANREQTNWPEKLATFYCRQLSILSIKRDPDHQITNCSGARAVVTGKKLSIKLLIKCSGFWIGVMTRLFTLYTTRLTMESEIEPPRFRICNELSATTKNPDYFLQDPNLSYFSFLYFNHWNSLYNIASWATSNVRPVFSKILYQKKTSKSEQFYF